MGINSLSPGDVIWHHGQHWFRWWIVAWWQLPEAMLTYHQLVLEHSIYLGPLLQKELKILFLEIHELHIYIFQITAVCPRGSMSWWVKSEVKHNQNHNQRVFLCSVQDLTEKIASPDQNFEKFKRWFVKKSVKSCWSCPEVVSFRLALAS